MRTLLIIDDQNSVLQVLDYQFSRRGYRTLLARTGATALELAATGAFQAALIDLHMPGMNGLAACRALRTAAIATGRDVPVWVMTAAHTQLEATLAVEAGAVALLKKPFDCDEFLDDVELYCEGNKSLPVLPSAAPFLSETAN